MSKKIEFSKNLNLHLLKCLFQTFAHVRRLVPKALVPLTQDGKTRALEATISGVRHRTRLRNETRQGRIRLIQNGCSQSSRFPTAGEGRRLWERN